MGTTYVVLKKGKLTIELDEMSNRFSLDITGGDVGAQLQESIQDVTTPRAWTQCSLTPDDVIKMALEMLKVASYWCDSDDFDKAVRAWRGTSNSYEATMLRSIGGVGAEE